MSLFPVVPSKENELRARMERLGIRETDLEESFIRSRGAGGQNVNKVSSCVVLRHRPTGLMVKCQTARSQGMNRFIARRLLLSKLEAKVHGAAAAERHRIEKIRRQKRRRSRRSRLKTLADKRFHSEKKQLRRSPSLHE